jgi:hypothetical protein
VLDMGTPVKILDVARQLVERSGDDVEITFTGLRPGEKLHEVLLSDDESAGRPIHPMIDHVTVPTLDLVRGLDACADVGVSPFTLDGLTIVALSPQTKNSDILDPARQVDRSEPATRRTP